MEYPVEMYTVQLGEVVRMRFKQDAPVDKPNWFMTRAEAEESMKPKEIQEEPAPKQSWGTKQRRKRS